jgi:hypothetical protein
MASPRPLTSLTEPPASTADPSVGCTGAVRTHGSSAPPTARRDPAPGWEARPSHSPHRLPRPPAVQTADESGADLKLPPLRLPSPRRRAKPMTKHGAEPLHTAAVRLMLGAVAEWFRRTDSMPSKPPPPPSMDATLSPNLAASPLTSEEASWSAVRRGEYPPWDVPCVERLVVAAEARPPEHIVLGVPTPPQMRTKPSAFRPESVPTAFAQHVASHRQASSETDEED